MPLVRVSNGGSLQFLTTRYDSPRNVNYTIPVAKGKNYLLISCDYSDYADFNQNSLFATTFVSGATVISSHAWTCQGYLSYQGSVQYYYIKATSDSIVIKKGSGLDNVSWELIEL